MLHQTDFPAKRMAAGAVLTNNAREVLIVKLAYKEGWGLPGGVVEEGESPYEACRRELAEELGLHLDPGHLLCVDYCSTEASGTENLQFLFDGGSISPQVAAQIRLPPEELLEWIFAPLDSARRLLRPKGSRRLAAVWPLIGSGRSVFPHNQRDPRDPRGPTT